MFVLLIGVVWILGIIVAAVHFSQNTNKKTSIEIMETVITQNDYPEIGTILSWANDQKIEIDYKGMLQ